MLFSRTLASLTFNDPYVPERMLAASYGVCMALWADPAGSSLRAVLPEFARSLVRSMFLPRGKARTSHVLSQDYALGVIELARRVAPRCIKQEDAPFLVRPLRAIKSPFRSARRISEEEAEQAKFAFRMDFENYTLGRLVPDRGNYQYDHGDYRAVRRQVLWRVQDLGYRTETFEQIDRRIAEMNSISRQSDPSQVDRYGKKYSWIAFFEMYGVRLDAGRLGEWRGDRPSDVDVDPSFPREPRDWRPEPSGLLSSAPTGRKAWLTSGASPDYRHVLRRDEIDGIPGPWLLMEGFIEETASDQRRLFSFVDARFTRGNDHRSLRRRFAETRYPTSHELGAPLDNYYTFAGEIPWSRRFAPSLWTDQGEPDPYRDHAFERYPFHEHPNGVEIEIPVCAWNWEYYHSELNQVGLTNVLAPALADRLHLVNHAREWDLYDQQGQRATVFARSSEPKGWESRLFFLREDLLNTYLRDTNQSLTWFVMGERDFATDVLLASRDAFADVFQRYQNVHKQAYRWNRRTHAPTPIK